MVVLENSLQLLDAAVASSAIPGVFQPERVLGQGKPAHLPTRDAKGFDVEDFRIVHYGIGSNGDAAPYAGAAGCTPASSPA